MYAHLIIISLVRCDRGRLLFISVTNSFSEVNKDSISIEQNFNSGYWLLHFIQVVVATVVVVGWIFLPNSIYKFKSNSLIIVLNILLTFGQIVWWWRNDFIEVDLMYIIYIVCLYVRIIGFELFWCEYSRFFGLIHWRVEIDFIIIFFLFLYFRIWGWGNSSMSLIFISNLKIFLIWFDLFLTLMLFLFSMLRVCVCKIICVTKCT